MTARAAADLLAPLRERPSRAGVLTDFDGTLARIVDDPAAARPLDGAVDALRGLVGRYAVVGVVSGRPASFLLEHVGAGPLLSGLYGLESVVDGRVVVHPDAAPYAEAVEAVAAEAEHAGPRGVGVERKGLAVTLHYRGDPELAEAVRAFAEDQRDRRGLALHVAKMSYELRPPLRRDKGTIVGEAVADLEAAVFFGDDRGDLDAFDALDALAARGGHGVKIAVVSAEAPPELLDRADAVVDGPAAVVDLLGLLAT